MWDQEKLQGLLIPLVAAIPDLKPLFPGAAIWVVEGQQVVNIQQLKHRKYSEVVNIQPQIYTLFWYK